jgi:hypothetical protein
VITEATVKGHLKAILRKLRLHNRTQAAMWAFNHLDVHGGNNDVARDLCASAIDHLKRPRANPEKPGSNDN